MALTVGTDTYISQIDATAYIDSYYPTTDTKRIAWNALTSDNKDTYLRSALRTLEGVPVVGLKADSTQTLAFPRAIHTENYFYDNTVPINLNYGNDWYVQTEVPDEVKYAQVETALSDSDGISDRVKLQREGVKSFSLGKLSESYGGGKINALPYAASVMMAEYLLGGGRIG